MDLTTWIPEANEIRFRSVSYLNHSKGQIINVRMPVHGSGGVSVRRRSAAHGCADAHLDAAAPGDESMSPSGENGGSRVITGLITGRRLSVFPAVYTYSNPCNVGTRYPVAQRPTEPSKQVDPL